MRAQAVVQAWRGSPTIWSAGSALAVLRTRLGVAHDGLREGEARDHSNVNR